METYHRKRSKRSTSSVNNEIMSLKWQETSSVQDGAQTQPPSLATHLLLTNFEVPDEDVEVGSVYEIYHKNLPPRTPVQLMSTRVVMVREKTDLNVEIRYPSILSLRTYFSNGNIMEMYPALDEKFVMGTKLARKVLLRQVPSQEFAEKKHLECFWLVNPTSQFKSHVVLKNEDIGLARELKNNMIRWGVRRQVMFVEKKREYSINTQSSSSFVHGEEDVTNQQQISNYVCKEDEEIANEPEEEDNGINDDLDDDDDVEIQHVSVERELNGTRNLRKRKNGKQVNHIWQANKKPMKKCRKLTNRDPTDRWSKERYMAAELSLLEAMKEKKAMIGNPITRPALRVEARKRIGDTGLLDHLLKHVANKVAPGGTLRFRRSHNADGAMEYWLENADLLKIRKDAGVSDPFWTPPPGWKPGDSPIQDPIVAKEINHLKQEIINMKRDQDISKKQFEDEIAKLRRELEMSKKQSEDEIAKLRREIQELTSLKKNKGDLQSEGVDSNPKQLTEIINSMLHSESETTEDDVDNSILQREKRNKDSLDFLKKKIQAEVRKETTSKTGTELISDEPKESKKPKVADHKNATVMALPAGDQKPSDQETAAADAPALSEGKAAKIERLKSGFRICRPQGTFRWPNNSTTLSSACSNMSSLQVEDLMQVVPTPPSVNSNSTPPQPLYHRHLSLPSPVKPVPERRPITVTISENIPPTITVNKSLINLNDIPANPSHMI